jgi:DNA invertase Pin-like site-specific DNA recombinase
MKKPYRNKVLRAFKKYGSINKTAKKLGVSTTYLYKHFPKLCQKYKYECIHIDKEVLLNKLESLISIKEVTDFFGVSLRTLYQKQGSTLRDFINKNKVGVVK